MTRYLCVLRDYATFRFVAGSINLCVELFQILLRFKRVQSAYYHSYLHRKLNRKQPYFKSLRNSIQICFFFFEIFKHNVLLYNLLC